MQIEWSTEKRRVDELKDHSRNPRKISSANLTKLEENLTQFGLASVPTINQDNTVIGGHQRIKALKKLKVKEIEVSVPNRQLDEEEVKRLNIILNKTAGEFDLDILTQDFEIKDLMELGFKTEELAAMHQEPEVKEDAEVDEDSDKKEEPITKIGDHYKLGEHYLLCSDCTEKKSIDWIKNHDKIDMIYTDPPYGIKLDCHFKAKSKLSPSSLPKKYKQVIGDNENFADLVPNLIFSNFSDVDDIFIWGGDYFSHKIPNKNHGSWIVWDKRQNENTATENFDKMLGSLFELCWSKKPYKREIARILWSGFFFSDKKKEGKRFHPTQKPNALGCWFFDRFGKKGDVVLDLFGGSGSTLLSCESSNRKCIMIEIDAGYCDVIVKRWIKQRQADAKDYAVLRNGEPCTAFS